MAIDPVEIVVTSAWEADHFPGAHVAVAAVDRVREEPLLQVLQQLLEEFLAVRAFKLEVAAFKSLQDLVPATGLQVQGVMIGLIRRR